MRTGQALMAHVIELNPVRRRLNFLQPEGVGRKTVEPRSPIGCQVRQALLTLPPVALAFEAGLSRVEIQQGLEIAPPAGIEPIHDDGDLVEIIWQGQYSVTCDEAGVDGVHNLRCEST